MCIRDVGTKANVTLAVGLPLTSFVRDKDKFIKYLKRTMLQPVRFEFEGVAYKVTTDDVKAYPCLLDFSLMLFIIDANFCLKEKE